MSWSSRNIAVTGECMYEDWETMTRYQRKCHTEEHALLELSGYIVIDNERDDEGENKDDGCLSQR